MGRESGRAGGGTNSTQGLGGPCTPDCGPQVQREGSRGKREGRG